jgi:hypothetical protein
MPMTTLTCEHLTAGEFQERLTAAQPGPVIVCATGFLAEDIHFAFLNKDSGAAELNTWRSWHSRRRDKGEAYLTQRRIGPRRFEYRVQKPNGR